MIPPREIACELVDQFWAKGPQCTHDHCVDKIAEAIQEAILSERREIMNLLGYDEAGEGLLTQEEVIEGVEITLTEDPYYDLEGALQDMRSMRKVDDVCLRSIERAQAKFADVSRRARELAGKS